RRSIGLRQCAEWPLRSQTRWFEISDDLAVGPIPDAQHAVLTASDNNLAVWRHCGGMHEVTGALKGAHLLAIFTHGANLIVAGTNHGLIRSAQESDRGHFLGEILQGAVGRSLFSLASHKVPNLDRVIRSAAGKRAAILLPAYAQHMVRVSFEGFRKFPGG